MKKKIYLTLFAIITCCMTFISCSGENIKEIKDIIKPELTLIGEENVQVQVGEKYNDPGCKSIDNVDGDITSLVRSYTKTKSTKINEKEIVYTSIDKAGNESEVVRHIEYIDKFAPTIELIGEEKITLKYGEEYVEQGVILKDNIDSKELLYSNLVITGIVDIATSGKYIVNYNITDSYGNKSSLKRIIVVKEKGAIPPKEEEIKPPKKEEQETVTQNQEDKVIYLTFDDGPGPYTEQLLDTLAKYNVKATFFVTLQNPSYSYLFKRMVNDGHTVAIHTATHDFSIYASEETYYDDLNKIKQEILNQTGITSNIVRFPGGSSNMVSKKYNEGIMTRLTASLEENGYEYYDWNIDSKDSNGQKLTPEQVKNNIINSLRAGHVNMVLQHDIKLFSVNAVEQTILEAKEMGYTFKAIDSNTPECKHGVNN